VNVTEAKKKLLLVEDDPGLSSQLKWALADYELLIAADREGAIAMVRREEPEVVVLDLGLPPDPNGAGEGLAALEAILTFRPDTKIIVSSGNEDRSNAVKAVSLGAYDFYPKPVDIDVLNLIIQRAFRLRELEVENQKLAKPTHNTPLTGLIAASSVMLSVCREVERIGSSEVSVLLTGESGSGKEVLARSLHELSSKASGPFIAINCAAIPENLLESELFGHEKGAFTGAAGRRVGRVEQAHRGTLFLDEIGDMPMSLQAKLLRFLQGHIFQRVGGREDIEIDVRIVSATNKDLKLAVRENRFREDLMYRLAEVSIHIPPLRQRDGDAVLLANHFLQEINTKLNKNVRGFTSGALAAIAAYEWPGNVRELENRMKRAVVMADGKMITPADLDLESIDVRADFPTLKQVREEAEYKTVTRALALSQNNVSAAAKLLGVARPTLYELMKNLNIRT